MIVIRTWEDLARALDSPLEAKLRVCLEGHRERLSEWSDYDFAEIASFIIAEPKDTLEGVVTELPTSIIDGLTFIIVPEYVDRHDLWIEACFLLSDDGFGVILLVQDHPDTDPDLLAAIAAAAERLSTPT